MNKLFYWHDWQRSYKITFWLLLLILIGFSLAIIVLQFMGVENLIQWHVLSQSSMFSVDSSVFSLGLFNFTITGYKSVINEIFSGGEMPSSYGYSHLLITLIGVAIVLYLSLVTMFRRFWYLVAMGGMLAFLILFHIETIQIFGWNDLKVLSLVFIILLSPSYYIHAYKPKAGFMFRVLVMSASLFALVLLTYLYSDIKEPFINLLSFGILAPFFLVLLYLFSVAHEIIAIFIYLISGTQGIERTTKMRHFLIIAFIYLVNILLSYLKVAHYIDWQLFFINPFVLLIISSLLGVWGSHNRAVLYEANTGQQVAWPLLNLVIAIISMATLVLFMISLNDPFIKVIGDIIIYAHLVVGVAFLLYIIYNFSTYIEQDHSIKSVLYKPKNLPFLTFKILSIMGIVALFSVRGFDYPVWYSMGGYNNVKADVALSNGHLDVAEAYYWNADAFAYHNHKANYTMGLLYSGKDENRSMEYFDKALDQQPSAQAAVNLANLKNAQQDFYGGLFALQKGYTKLPGNVHLLNNMALQFARLKLLDSADYYLKLAGISINQTKNNRLALNARYGLINTEDSIVLFNNLDRVGRANAAALGVVNNIPVMDTGNHMFDMVLLNNWLLSGKPGVEDNSLTKALIIIENTTNRNFKDQLLYSWSIAALNAGNISVAIESLQNLAFNSTDWSDAAKIALVKLYNQQGAFSQAIDILYSLDKNDLNLDLAVALLENGDKEETLSFWQNAARSNDEHLALVANDILAVVFAEKPVLDTDEKIYLYIRYNRFYLDEFSANELLKKIEKDYLRIGLALDLAAFYHQLNNASASIKMLQNIEGLAMNKIQYRQYLIEAALIGQNTESVQTRLAEFDSLFEFESNEYLMEYTLNHLAGMQLDSTAYLQMATDNPFFPDAVLIGASYFANNKDDFRGYDLLAHAVQKNPDSPVLTRAYILKALDVGLDQFAENALFEYSQKFSGQAYLQMKKEYDEKLAKMNSLLELELND